MEQSKIYLERTIRQLETLRQQERNLLVVSDLHLSEGFDEAEGKWSINEDFFFDGRFARFLQFAERQRTRYGGAPWRLICNGDTFDFRQVGVLRGNEDELEPVAALRKREASRGSRKETGLSENEKTYGPGTTRLMSDWRVGRVYQGHKGFFQALAWFVARGNELVFIKGNHDMEMHWLKVQVRIKRQLRQAYDEARAGGLYDLDWDGLPETLGRSEQERVFFLPWNYYEPKRVYIEHGHQFHSTDSESHVLWPMLPWNENELELGLGELFGRYFTNKLEELFPLIDNMKPFSEGVKWVLNKGIPAKLSSGSFWSALKALWNQLKHARRGIARVYGKYMDNRRYQRDAQEFAEKRKAELAEYGERTGLGAACVHDLDALKNPPQLRSRGLVRNWLIIRFLEVAGILFLLVALLATLSALALLGVGAAFLGLNKVMAAVALLGWGVAALIRWAKLKMQRFQEHLLEKAGQIHRTLREHGKDVKYVLMGHDHHALLKRLDADHLYANSGTWTSLIVHEDELVQNARQSTFVRLVGDTAHLMRWNDGSGAWEPVVLYADSA
jgi:UDP-2,3-diacylglucosamine pyrophosphatase LpxH